MASINKLFVSIKIEGKEHRVGELVLSGKKIYFRYNQKYLKKGFNLSPFRLPFNGEISSVGREPFDGLFGVFNDSLPDGWGRLILDRGLSEKGVDVSQITPMDRLAFVGRTGLGALKYEPEIGNWETFNHVVELDSLNREMQNILHGESSEILEELITMGGSSVGARPKIFIGYNSQKDQLIHGTDNYEEGFQDWIIKFPSISDSPEIALIEYSYHKMAVTSGIEMSECKLFTTDSGKAYFGTKRFDRIGNQRLHMHSAAGLMHDNFRMSNMDYGHIMDCAFQLEKHVQAYEKVFRLAAFNTFAHNLDDHSKNFSFLMNAQGDWVFAPAYDLVFSNSTYGFHSTMIAGESKNPGTKNLLELATHFSVKDADKIIEQVLDSISLWSAIAKDCGVTSSVRKEIKNTLDKVYSNT